MSNKETERVISKIDIDRSQFKKSEEEKKALKEAKKLFKKQGKN